MESIQKMKFYYDLHIHSALSPCGDEEMTPNNIVNMSIIKGLDIIAVSDHNSCANVGAVMNVALDTPITVIPAMEIESSEEVHLLCLFGSLEGCITVGDVVKAHMPSIENKEEIFGVQSLINEYDEIIGKEKNLLITATDLNLMEVKDLVEENGGVCIPAHIDRNSYSVLSNLGFITDEMKFTYLEVSRYVNKEEYRGQSPFLDGYSLLQNSDAHYLEDISEKVNYLQMFDKNLSNIIKILLKK